MAGNKRSGTEDRKIRWTPKQREVLNLIDKGLSDDEIREQGHGTSTIRRVKRNLKMGWLPPPETPEGSGSGARGAAPPSVNLDHPPPLREKTYETVTVGEIVIEPLVWRIGQYGGFLILNTYAYAKQNYGYSGSVGDLLCDACQVLRRAMGQDVLPLEQYTKEEPTNGGKETGEGDFILEASGSGAGSGEGSES